MSRAEGEDRVIIFYFVCRKTKKSLCATSGQQSAAFDGASTLQTEGKISIDGGGGRPAEPKGVWNMEEEKKRHQINNKQIDLSANIMKMSPK